MKLICEVIEQPLELIVEEKDNQKKYYIEGIFMQADLPNRNGRYYPISTLEKEVDRYVAEYVNKNKAYGELGHPQGPTINLDRVSHLFTNLRKEGSNFIGRAKIVDTPNGDIVKSLLKEGANLGVSSRGMGSLKPRRDGIMEVQNDFKLASAGDIVADPSAPDAFVEGIYEGVEWVEVGGRWVPEYLEVQREQLHKAKKGDIENVILESWQKFIKNITLK